VSDKLIVTPPATAPDVQSDETPKAPKHAIKAGDVARKRMVSQPTQQRNIARDLGAIAFRQFSFLKHNADLAASRPAT